MTDLPIPLEALADCGAILGRRGAGKSGTGRVLLEHELAAGHRCCAIDPKGDWWGIRMDKAGKPSGFDLPIFGGAHGDVALTEDMGEMLGRLVATHDLSCVVDLSAFPSQAAQRRFARDFAESLFEHNRQPITLFLDEADQLAPQRVPADMARLLHAMETLIRLGRQRGIFMWMLTQRPQILNKNLLSQAESLVAMKVTTPHDRGAIREWMEAHDPDQAKEIEKQLAKLDVGEAFVWVPAADFLERVRFPLFATYDSGRTPRHGETVEAVSLPKIDLSAVQAALAAVEPQPPTEPPGSRRPKYPDDTIPADPKAAWEKGGDVGRMLKEREARIAELETEVERLWRARASAAETFQRVIALHRATLARMSEAALEQIARLNESQAKIGADAEPMEEAKAEPVSRPAAGRSAAATAERMAATAGETAPPRAVRQRAAPEGLPSQAEKMADMLDRIAPARVTWASLAAMVKIKPRGGHFNAGRKALRESGRIVEEGDTIRSAAPPREGMTREGARQLWKEVLKNPAPQMIDALACGPLTRTGLGLFLGIADHGGHFNGGVAQLVRNGVAIDVAGRLELANPLPGEKP